MMPRRLQVEPGSLVAGKRVIADSHYHYLFRVLRLDVGARLTLFDGAGASASATVESIEARQATLQVAEPSPLAPPPEPEVIVAQAVIKGDRMDWCIQKLVELGVSEIIPVRTARSVALPRGDRAAKKRLRLAAIAADAVRQSRRLWLPKLSEIIDLDELWGRTETTGLNLVLWAGESDRTLAAELASAAKPRQLCVLVGPEGGFEPGEIDRARAAGFTAVGLGPHILRAETAAIAAAALIGFQFGDLANT